MSTKKSRTLPGNSVDLPGLSVPGGRFGPGDGTVFKEKAEDLGMPLVFFWSFRYNIISKPKGRMQYVIFRDCRGKQRRANRLKAGLSIPDSIRKG